MVYEKLSVVLRRCLINKEQLCLLHCSLRESLRILQLQAVQLLIFLSVIIVLPNLEGRVIGLTLPVILQRCAARK